MKRLGRWLFNFAAGASLLLCAAMAVIWVRSHLINDRLYWSRFWDDAQWSYWSQHILHSGAGEIAYARIVQGQSLNPGWQAVLSTQNTPARKYSTSPSTRPAIGFSVQWSYWGITYGHRPFGPGRADEIVVPIWTIIAISAILPGIWLLRQRMLRRRRMAGRCATCGYDLRATPDRCPECGTVPKSMKGAAG